MTAARDLAAVLIRLEGAAGALRLVREMAGEESPTPKRTPKELDEEVRRRLWRAGVSVDDDAA